MGLAVVMFVTDVPVALSRILCLSHMPYTPVAHPVATLTKRLQRLPADCQSFTPDSSLTLHCLSDLYSHNPILQCQIAVSTHQRWGLRIGRSEISRYQLHLKDGNHQAIRVMSSC